jgi:hypothetical protein
MHSIRLIKNSVIDKLNARRLPVKVDSGRTAALVTAFSRYSTKWETAGRISVGLDEGLLLLPELFIISVVARSFENVQMTSLLAQRNHVEKHGSL